MKHRGRPWTGTAITRSARSGVKWRIWRAGSTRSIPYPPALPNGAKMAQHKIYRHVRLKTQELIAWSVRTVDKTHPRTWRLVSWAVDKKQLRQPCLDKTNRPTCVLYGRDPAQGDLMFSSYMYNGAIIKTVLLAPLEGTPLYGAFGQRIAGGPRRRVKQVSHDHVT